jgi:hypothetical protein
MKAGMAKRTIVGTSICYFIGGKTVTYRQIRKDCLLWLTNYTNEFLHESFCNLEDLTDIFKNDISIVEQHANFYNQKELF